MSEAGDLLLDPARAAFERALTGRGHRPIAEVKAAQLGEDAGIVGAAGLALEAASKNDAVPAREAAPRTAASFRSDHRAVVPVVRAAWARLVHPQHEDGEPGDERRDSAERRESRYRPARSRRHAR